MRLHHSIRRRLNPDPARITPEGDLSLVSIAAARRLAAEISAASIPGIGAADLLAASLIHEIQHRIIRLRLTGAPLPLDELEQRTGSANMDKLLRTVTEVFPPEAVFRGEKSAEDYLRGANRRIHRSRMLEEYWLLELAASNPALRRVNTLCPITELREETGFSEILPALELILRKQQPGGGSGPALPDALSAAMYAAPDSLSGQLEFLRREWGAHIPDLLGRIDSAMDLAAEERPPAPPPPQPDAGYWRQRQEFHEGKDHFSTDRGWMADLVLLAKHTHVWLSQLSHRWQRPVRTLADIPDEELDSLAAQGFTGIWLLGLWERSSASLRIKRLGGDPEALASAYAVNRYRVAPELGGNPALESLSRRAAERGIRLGADMVPNHMGLDSPLLMERPDLFIHRDDLPYPGYTFNGPELSREAGVSIRIEDHYFDRSDAAVVFRLRDRGGRERYIYHGNDGTHIPWNDTAQLDFLQEEVRHRVLDQIRTVARMVPIIRFDAAMTLTRKHFRRLWYPPPGQGGAIPSRAEAAMTEGDFNQRMPGEFWRRVVDTAESEFPDTLLLAEAFWLMESYFVRRLGMHRVYNSAFMHMLRNEDNAGFREYIRTIWKENPAILSRFVNFLSNPDEDSAVGQFGRGDKYFAACILMLTLPGLPMFAHGQVEGLAEKYGMEFAAPRSGEFRDDPFADHHKAFVFPLMRQRSRFSGADDLQMFTLRTEDDGRDENVLAFSRGRGRDILLVMVHNRYAETAGYLRDGDLEPGPSLIDTLRISADCDGDLCFHDRVTGARIIQPAPEIRRRGLHFRFKAYGHHLLEFEGIRNSRQSQQSSEKPKVEISSTLEYSLGKKHAPGGGKKDGKKKREKTEKKKPDPRG